VAGRTHRFPSSYLGETQIVNGRGETLAWMSREDGEGVITADIELGEALPFLKKRFQ